MPLLLRPPFVHSYPTTSTLSTQLARVNSPLSPPTPPRTIKTTAFSSTSGNEVDTFARNPGYQFKLTESQAESLSEAKSLLLQISERRSLEANRYFRVESNLLIQMGILATVAEPAIAVTGVNTEPDLVSVLIQLGVLAFGYFLIMPPIIMNWLRIRWYRRNLVEMYFQFMFVFVFFPGLLIWAPFLNFRKFPRDPNMKYPWSKPDNPDQITGGFLKYPWASIEDYE